jgi:hypothetical protein
MNILDLSDFNSGVLFTAAVVLVGFAMRSLISRIASHAGLGG